MVTLTEVEDEHFQGAQQGANVDDDDFSDTGMLPPQLASYIAQVPR